MDELGELAIGLIIAVSIVGIIVPILPGLLVEILAVFVWAAVTGGAVAWGVAIFALLVGGVGTFVKYAVPKRHLSEGGIPNRTLIVATVVAIVGLFVIPVIGAPIGFVLPMEVGALLMSLSTVVVALNAQLLRRLDLSPQASVDAVRSGHPARRQTVEREPALS